VQANVSRASLSIDVRGAALAGCDALAADVFWRPEAPGKSGSRPVVVFCFPGGGMSRRYFDLPVDGYSMAVHLAACGYVVVSIDHPGVGGSEVPDDPWELTPETVADVDSCAVRQVLEQLRAGDLPGLPLGEPGFLVGLGHSAGALVVIHQQARHSLFDALSLLGWAGHGLPQHLDESERDLAKDPQLLERNVVAAARRRYPEALMELRRGSSNLLVGNKMPREVRAALVGARTPLLTVVGLASMIPGGAAKPAARVTVPVFLAVGERDIATDHLRIPAEFPKAADVTLYVLPQAGHNHNVAANRRDLWDRMAAWLSSVAPENWRLATDD
jgi:alpha-beta hydrolase superfamily lysophospholipase